MMNNTNTNGAKTIGANNNTNNLGGNNNMKTLERASVKTIAKGIRTIRKASQLNKAINKGIHALAEVPVARKINIVVELDDNGNGQTTVGAVLATNSEFSASFDYWTKEAQVDLDGYMIKVGGDSGKYITTDFVYVSCKDCGEYMTTIIEQLKQFGLYKKGSDVYFPSYDLNGQLELRHNSPRGPIVQNADIFVAQPNVTHYVFFNASPSQERVGDFMGIDATKYSKEERYEIQNKLTGGALEYATNQGEMELAKAVKIGTRLALQNTASIQLGTVGNDEYGVLYVKSEIEGADDYTNEMKAELDNLGVDIDKMIVDGEGLILADMMQDYFQRGGVDVAYSAIKGSGFQMRTVGINDKVFNLAISRKEMAKLVEYFMAKYDCIVVGNAENIAYVVDGNGAKLPNMWRFDKLKAKEHGVEYGNFMMNILAMAMDSEAKSSIQAIGKVYNDEVIADLTINQHNMLTNSLDRITKGSISVDGKCARAQKLFAANLERSTKSHVAHDLMMSELSDQAIAAIQKVKVPVDGVNLRAFFDNTFMYTKDDQSIFKVREGGVIEAYSKSATKRYRKELKEIFNVYLVSIKEIDEKEASNELTKVEANLERAKAKTLRTVAVDELLSSFTVKYPCPTNIEFAKFRYLADFEVVEAIEDLDTDASTKKVLRDLILQLNDGIVMIAPLNTLKHKLAGMDTDFDGVTSFFERSIVKSAYAKNFNDVVYIDKKGAKSEFNPNNKCVAKQEEDITNPEF